MDIRRVCAGSVAACTFALAALAQDAPVEDETSVLQPDLTLTGAEALEDLALARQALEAIHPGYDRYASADDLDTRWTTMEFGIGPEDGEIGLDAFYAMLSYVLAGIRCDHTLAELPSDVEDHLNTQPTHLPFRFVWSRNAMVVTAAAPGVDLQPGDQVVSINATPAGYYFREVAQLIPIDGDTNHAKAHRFARSAEFRGSAFDHFRGLAPVADGEEATDTLRVIPANDPEIETPQTRTVARITYPDFLAIEEGARYRNFSEEVDFETIGEDGGILAINTFVNYRTPVDPIAHLAPFFKTMADEGRTKLILDLRQTSGGSTDAMLGVFAHLLPEPATVVSHVEVKTLDLTAFAEHIDTWDPSALTPDASQFDPLETGGYRYKSEYADDRTRPTSPAEHAFTGELAVLIGPANASGATHLLAALQSNRPNTTFIGEPTGGAATGATAGVIFFLDLPNSGVRVRVPWQRTVTANADNLPPRQGVRPDLRIARSAQDIRDGRDPALAAAIAHLGIDVEPDPTP